MQNSHIPNKFKKPQFKNNKRNRNVFIPDNNSTNNTTGFPVNLPIIIENNQIDIITKSNTQENAKIKLIDSEPNQMEKSKTIGKKSVVFTNPTDTTNPADPTNPTDPTDSTDSTDPTKPTESTNSDNYIITSENKLFGLIVNKDVNSIRKLFNTWDQTDTNTIRLFSSGICFGCLNNSLDIVLLLLKLMQKNDFAFDQKTKYLNEYVFYYACLGKNYDLALWLVNSCAPQLLDLSYNNYDFFTIACKNNDVKIAQLIQMFFPNKLKLIVKDNQIVGYLIK